MWVIPTSTELALGLEELGRQVVIELMQYWMSLLLTEKEQDRLVA